MKKNIFAPDVRVIRFDSQDVIVTSIGSGTVGCSVGNDGQNVGDYNENQFAPGRSIWD